MRRAALALCASMLACGGQSQRDDALGQAGASGVAGTSAAGASAGVGAVGGVGGESTGGAAGNAGAGGTVVGDDCLEPGMSGALAGPFATPSVVWERISRAVSGAVGDPPSPLPDQTSQAWAGQIALEAFDRDWQSQTAPAGLQRFLENWLGPNTSTVPEVTERWAWIMAGEGATLATLLALPDDIEPARVGVFSDATWLTFNPSIDSRGSRMLKALTGQEVPLPSVLPPAQDAPELTDREDHDALMSDPACQGCHVLIDGFGYSLEHFDALGQYRDVDDGKPIDASGYVQSVGNGLMYTDIVDLAPQLAEACAVGKAVGDAFYLDALVAAGVLDPSASPPYPNDLVQVSQRFFASGKSFRSLVQATAESEAMLRD